MGIRTHDWACTAPQNGNINSALIGLASLSAINESSFSSINVVEVFVPSLLNLCIGYERLTSNWSGIGE